MGHRLNFELIIPDAHLTVIERHNVNVAEFVCQIVHDHLVALKESDDRVLIRESSALRRRIRELEKQNRERGIPMIAR